VPTCDVLCTVPDSTGVDSTEGACYSYIGNAGSPARSIEASVVPATVMPDSIGIHAAYSSPTGPCAGTLAASSRAYHAKHQACHMECAAGAGTHDTGWACHTKQAYVINTAHNRRAKQCRCPSWTEQECCTECSPHPGDNWPVRQATSRAYTL